MTAEISDLGDDIVPDAVPEHVVCKRSKFAPWHKVRKHFIRTCQWNSLIARYFRRYLPSHLHRPTSDSADAMQLGRQVSCLIIPGEDLLDMRSLCADLQSLGINCRIRYLGFNASHSSNEEGTKLHIANNQVVAHSLILKDSVVIRDRFQAITSKTSMASRYLRDYGPFHIVNLDLCDSLFPNSDGDMVSYYKALVRLIEFQMHHQTTPWLLFITTEVAPREVDSSVFSQFCQPTHENYRTHGSFADRFHKLLPSDTFSDPARINPRLTEEELLRLFGVAMGKTLLGLSKSSSPQWKVEMLPSHRYPIKAEDHVHMLSLAYQFRPVRVSPVDGTGIATSEPVSTATFDECKLALKVINAVEHISDVECILSEQPELKSRIESASASLMEEAGYDRAEYLGWVVGDQSE